MQAAGFGAVTYARSEGVRAERSVVGLTFSQSSASRARTVLTVNPPFPHPCRAWIHLLHAHTTTKPSSRNPMRRLPPRCKGHPRHRPDCEEGVPLVYGGRARSGLHGAGVDDWSCSRRDPGWRAYATASWALARGHRIASRQSRPAPTGVEACHYDATAYGNQDSVRHQIDCALTRGTRHEATSIGSTCTNGRHMVEGPTRRAVVSRGKVRRDHTAIFGPRELAANDSRWLNSQQIDAAHSSTPLSTRSTARVVRPQGVGVWGAR